MNLQHKSEWKELVTLSHKNNLTLDNTIFLLDLREVEDGKEGNEFGIKEVKGTDLKTQALWAIGSILKNERRWQEYIRKNGRIEFIDFFANYGGPYGTGWHSQNKNEWIDNMYYFINQINKEIENGLSGIDNVG